MRGRVAQSRVDVERAGTASGSFAEHPRHMLTRSHLPSTTTRLAHRHLTSPRSHLALLCTHGHASIVLNGCPQPLSPLILQPAYHDPPSVTRTLLFNVFVFILARSRPSAVSTSHLLLLCRLPASVFVASEDHCTLTSTRLCLNIRHATPQP